MGCGASSSQVATTEVPQKQDAMQAASNANQQQQDGVDKKP